jgi:hypothetical protein
MARTRRPNGPIELLVVESEAFPNSVIVELWHENDSGKREFLDSRRYEAFALHPEEDERAAAQPVGVAD